MKDIIMEILKNLDNGEAFENSENFIDDGLIDSYQMVEIVDELESEFDIEISGRDIIPDNFVNLAAIETLVAKYTEG